MPVHSAHVEDHAGRIADILREARTARGWSLRQLARATSVSAAQLSNIETGRAGTDFGQMLRFAQALGVPVNRLLPASSVRHHFVNRRQMLFRDASTLVPQMLSRNTPAAPYHNTFWPLAEPYAGRHMEPYLARVAHLDGELSLVTTEPQTLAFVLRGAMELRVRTADGVCVEVLNAGDSVLWDSHVPHLSRTASDATTEVLCVVSPPSGRSTPNTELAGTPVGAHRVFREQDAGNAVAEAGRRISFVRLTNGVLPADLARAVGLSVRQLLAVESGRRPVRMDTLYRVARVFRLPVKYFLPRPDNLPVYSVRRAPDVVNEPALHRADGTQPGVRYHPLTTSLLEWGLHPYLVRFPTRGPDSVSCFPGEQLLYVLDGEVELEIQDGGASRELLRPGDAAYFQTSCPHRVRGITRSPYAAHAAEAVAVFWSPTDDPGLVSGHTPTA